MSAAGATRGMPIWSILVFPVLFTAGMTLVDTTTDPDVARTGGVHQTNPQALLQHDDHDTVRPSLLFRRAVLRAWALGGRSGNYTAYSACNRQFERQFRDRCYVNRACSVGCLRSGLQVEAR